MSLDKLSLDCDPIEVERERWSRLNYKSNRIRYYRESLGLTQCELGRRFKKPKDPALISRWERGVAKPSFDNIFELAEILNVSPEDLFSPDQD